MRKRTANPYWHNQFNSGNVANVTTNALNIYLEIVQLDNQFTVKTWDGRTLGVFDSAKDAETFARTWRSSLSPIKAIEDIRFVPDPKLAPPKPRKHVRVDMEPIPVTGNEFVPIIEDEEVVVEHPADVITF